MYAIRCSDGRWVQDRPEYMPHTDDGETLQSGREIVAVSRCSGEALVMRREDAERMKAKLDRLFGCCYRFELVFRLGL